MNTGTVRFPYGSMSKASNLLMYMATSSPAMSVGWRLPKQLYPISCFLRDWTWDKALDKGQNVSQPCDRDVRKWRVSSKRKTMSLVRLETSICIREHWRVLARRMMGRWHKYSVPTPAYPPCFGPTSEVRANNFNLLELFLLKRLCSHKMNITLQNVSPQCPSPA